MCLSQTQAQESANDPKAHGVQLVERKMDKIVKRHHRNLDEARKNIGLFLHANGFPKGGKAKGWSLILIMSDIEKPREAPEIKRL